MTNTITKSKLESYAYNNVHDYVNNRSYIVDPRDPTAVTGRQFVYHSDPYSQSVEFNNYPCIIVELPTLEYSMVSLNGKVKHIGWTFRIIVRTARDGSSSGTSGVGLTDMQDICDDLNELFNSEARKQEFRNLRMFKPVLTKVNTDVLSVEGKSVFVAEYELVFEERITVSS